jgi:uncharacterized RDD family membrane protein YckC
MPAKPGAAPTRAAKNAVNSAAQRSAAAARIDAQAHEYRGQRLGLPNTGPGSLASTGRRLGAIAIDWAISYGLAALVVGGKIVVSGQFVALSLLAVCYLIGLAINGATFGMAILGLRVTSQDGSKPSLYAIGMRTVLLFLVIPPVVTDQDGRGLHDLLAKTYVVNTR